MARLTVECDSCGGSCALLPVPRLALTMVGALANYSAGGVCGICGGAATLTITLER